MMSKNQHEKDDDAEQLSVDRYKYAFILQKNETKKKKPKSNKKKQSKQDNI